MGLHSDSDAPAQHRIPYIANTAPRLPTADDSGAIDYGEFLHIIRRNRTAYTDALFRSVDVDNSGSVDFAEFVHMLGNFCVHDPQQLTDFVMAMFDLNHGRDRGVGISG